MELRSSRSRSRTPFLQNHVESATYSQGNHIEETVIRTTRSTTVKSFENVSSSDSASVNSSRFLRSRLPKTDAKSYSKSKQVTSDYSSEEGETEITTTRHISENDRNQLIEDARLAANGSSEVSALGLYRKAGRYWDVYPKTDWTYSRSSRDRVELAPGVVAMPNMSRRSLHSRERSVEHLYSHHKEHDETDRHLVTDYKYKPRSLFANNNCNNEYEYTVSSRSASYRRQTWISRIVSTFVSVLTIFYSVLEYQWRGWVWIGKKIHTAASRLMLMDTYLLSQKRNRKLAGLLWLILLPLLLFGGWYLLSTLGQALQGALSNISLPLVIPSQNPVQEKIVKVTEKVYLEPPSAGEIAAGLTQAQLEEIASKLKGIPPTEYQGNVGDQESTIRSLKQQINAIKLELEDLERSKAEQSEFDRVIARLQLENSRIYREMKSCCRRGFVNIEPYVLNVLRDVISNPDYVKDREQLASWLHTIFVAKQDLELRLANLTQNLKADYDATIESSGSRIMDDVTARIGAEIQKIVRYSGEFKEISVSDDRIHQIVKEALAKYDADKTGLVDYAMESMGGQIVSTRCSETYHARTAVLSILGIPLWYPTSSPRAVITPGINPGQCWPFQNFPGFLVVKLAVPVKIDAFSYEHVSRDLVIDGNISSAPREFEVYGLKDEDDKEPLLLAHFKYDKDGEPLQFFSADSRGLAFQLVEIRIISNHGNPNYTCLYRFRVHGKVSKDPI